MSSDKFSHHADSPIAPARHVFTIVPDDTTSLSPVPKALFVGGAGTLTLRGVDSDEDVTLFVQAGQMLPVRPSFVRSTGTTATGIVGLA